MERFFTRSFVALQLMLLCVVRACAFWVMLQPDPVRRRYAVDTAGLYCDK